MRAESTPGARGPVFCGVDTHADSHWLCVLDWRGRKVLSRRFPADAAGYEALAGAIAAAGEPACIGLPLDWDRRAFEAERKMDSKKHLAK